MIKIDNSLLEEIGLGGLPNHEKDSLLKHVYETLEMRVGMRLADQMTNQQLDEFERYFEAKDDAGAFKWLETNFPNYKDVVQEEFDKLKGEVKTAAPQILAAAQAAPPQVVSPGTPPVAQDNWQQATPPPPAASPQPSQPPADFGMPGAQQSHPPYAQPGQPPLPPQAPFNPNPNPGNPGPQQPFPNPNPANPGPQQPYPPQDDFGQQQQPPAGPGY